LYPRNSVPIPDNFIRIEGGTFPMGSPDTEVGHEGNETQSKTKKFLYGEFDKLRGGFEKWGIFFANA
jgi:formylglycine-generating enzyme required for sulfatase activity